LAQTSTHQTLLKTPMKQYLLRTAVGLFLLELLPFRWFVLAAAGVVQGMTQQQQAAQGVGFAITTILLLLREPQ
jgi:hypothetical protein